MQIFRMDRGTDFSFDVDICYPLQIPDIKVFFNAKRSMNDPDPPLIRRDSIFGGITKVSGRVVRIALRPEDTLALPNESFIYPFTVTVRTQEGRVFSVLAGQLEVRAAVKAGGF